MISSSLSCRRVFVTAMSFLVGVSVFAQNTSPVSNHSISAQAIGVGYSYEQRLGSQFTIVGRAAFASDIVDFYSSNDALSLDASFCPVVSVEPRLYANLSKRAAKGKNTEKNSGDFVSVCIGYMMNGTDMAGDVVITPAYGIRRVVGKHLLTELTGGVKIYDTGCVLPHLQVKVGFVF